MDIATVIGLVGTLGLIAWAMDDSRGPRRVYRILHPGSSCLRDLLWFYS